MKLLIDALEKARQCLKPIRTDKVREVIEDIGRVVRDYKDAPVDEATSLPRLTVAMQERIIRIATQVLNFLRDEKIPNKAESIKGLEESLQGATNG